ncbi:MAG: hypothetical protein H7X95_11130, partial [Deltaproteobacteria bacterium]|nr:hypothetical protein [Deltaproteobacteria bacterium]
MMGSIDSVPAAFQLTVVDGQEWLSFQAPAGIPWPTGAVETVGPPPWAQLQALELAVPFRQEAVDADVAWKPAGKSTETLARFQNRRLAVGSATLATGVDRLQAAAGSCGFAAFGISDLKVWMAPVGLCLAGRFTVGGAEAPFTIRIGVDLGGAGGRRLIVNFSDVRLFAPLPPQLSPPALLVGTAIAQAIGAGTAVAVDALRVGGSTIDLDPLEISLASELVSRGWRLPDLSRLRLQSVVMADPLQMQLQFDKHGHPTEPLPTLEFSTSVSPSTALRFGATAVPGDPLVEHLVAAVAALETGQSAHAAGLFNEVAALA